MSATRDKSQKITFVYSNLYSLYRKGKDAATGADVPAAPRGLTTSQVLKAETVRPAEVAPFRPTEFIERRLQARAPGPSRSEGHYQPILNESVEKGSALGLSLKIARPAPVAITPETTRTHASAVDGLRKNLSELQDLHERLRFMLQELEDLVKS